MKASGVLNIPAGVEQRSCCQPHWRVSSHVSIYSQHANCWSVVIAGLRDGNLRSAQKSEDARHTWKGRADSGPRNTTFLGRCRYTYRLTSWPCRRRFAPEYVKTPTCRLPTRKSRYQCISCSSHALTIAHWHAGAARMSSPVTGSKSSSAGS